MAGKTTWMTKFNFVINIFILILIAFAGSYWLINHGYNNHFDTEKIWPILKTNDLFIYDKKEMMRGHLYVQDFGPPTGGSAIYLELYDDEGKEVARLSEGHLIISKNGLGLTPEYQKAFENNTLDDVKNADYQVSERIYIGRGLDNTLEFNLEDKNTNRLTLRLDKENKPGIEFYDEKGTTMMSLGSVELVYDNGKKEFTPESSLYFYNKQTRKVIKSLP